MSDPTLFDEQPDLLHGAPIIVVAVCHRCGAHTAPSGPDAIPLTDDGDPSSPWTGVNVWAVLALKRHDAECPGFPAAGPTPST